MVTVDCSKAVARFSMSIVTATWSTVEFIYTTKKGEHNINISKNLTDVTFSELDQPEGNNYYTIDQSEFKEAMDEPEQVLASVIKALRKEQAKEVMS